MSDTPWTPGPWRIPGANVFRVVAPDAPHTNKREGLCPPYEWAVVCETEPDSVPPEQASANARLIAAAPSLAEALKGCVKRLRDAEYTYRRHRLGTPHADTLKALITQSETALREAGVGP